MSRCWMVLAVSAVMFFGITAWSSAAEPAAGEQDGNTGGPLKKIEAPEARKEEPGPVPPEKKGSWLDRVKFFGDLRFRYEQIKKHGWTPKVDDQERKRVRARFGFDAKMSADVDLRVRVATSEAKKGGNVANPVSTNWTLTNAENKRDIWLDLARMDYHPSTTPGLHLIIGKMETPFYTAGKSDLIWDRDLTPTGGAVTYCPQFGDLQLVTAAAGFTTMERAAASGPKMLGIQAGLKRSFPDKKAYILGGAGYYDFMGTEGHAVCDWQGANKGYGNSKNGNLYRFDYNVLELFGEAGCEIEAGSWKIPVSVFGNAVQNLAGGVEDGKGWLVGFSVGKLDKPGSVAFRYDYRELERDAVLGAFTDSDSWGGGTNGRGHKLALEVQAMKNVTVGVGYFLDEANISGGANKNGDYGRLQLDVGFKYEF